MWQVQYSVEFWLWLLGTSSLPAESSGQPDGQHGGRTVGQGGRGQPRDGRRGLAQQLGDHPAGRPVLRGGGRARRGRGGGGPQCGPEW